MVEVMRRMPSVLGGRRWRAETGDGWAHHFFHSRGLSGVVSWPVMFASGQSQQMGSGSAAQRRGLAGHTDVRGPTAPDCRDGKHRPSTQQERERERESRSNWGASMEPWAQWKEATRMDLTLVLSFLPCPCRVTVLARLRLLCAPACACS